jgi:hypothetical protein
VLSKTLTVQDVLAAPAEYDHSYEIRSIGPAVVLVLEREGPMRMEALYSTEGELLALEDEIRSNPRWSELLGVYFESKEDEDEELVRGSELWAREEAHTEGLSVGQRSVPGLSQKAVFQHSLVEALAATRRASHVHTKTNPRRGSNGNG